VSDHNHEQTVVDAVPRELLIGGEWRAATGGRTFVVEDPSTGAALTEVADGTPEDGLAALDAAVAAQDGWAATPPRVRGEILRRTYELLVERREDLALLMTLEMGKSLSDSRAEVSYAAEFFRWFSEEAVRIDGSYTISPAGGARLLTLRQPVGPCLLITPWNFPMAMGTRKLGPAIAAGCTMICKPAALTPLSMLALARLLEHREHQDRRRGNGPGDRRPSTAQAELHRFNRDRPRADQAGGGQRPQGLHGARWQRPVRRVRRC
jgi:succinate-semialdehyde dehydrogenase/glutarate-semialdehyde dehydrogenase